MGREVRRVPANWAHPYDMTEHRAVLRPLLDGDLAKLQAEWDVASAKWQEGLCDDYHGGWEPRGSSRDYETYEEWDGKRPVAEDYMPQWPESERTHYQMYETCSEGTPISPVCASPEELAHWLADNEASACGSIGASYEGWLRVCKGGFAPSMVLQNGVVKSGVEGCNIPKDPEEILPSIY